MVVDPALETVIGARGSSGMKFGQGALEIDPPSVPAMQRMSGWALLRADFRDNDANYEAGLKEAIAWQQKEAALIGSAPASPPPPSPPKQ